MSLDATVSLETRIKAQAFGLGFDLVGICALGPAETAEAFDNWLARGFAGSMAYLPRGREKRRDSRLPVPGAVSAIAVGMNYGGREPSGSVARYARGDDYHDVMLERLTLLHSWLDAEVGEPVLGKSYVDTGPILERDLARRAGLGWFGKNTNLNNPALGSFFFLGVLLVGIDLVQDEPFAADRCGSCTRCLEACPTDALVAPRLLDATRCISYLTIELKGEVPVDLRSQIGDLIYGCDICQDVCPWNRRSPRADPAVLGTREELINPALEWLAAMTEEEFRSSFRGSPIKRTKYSGMRRNVAIAMGNSMNPEFVPALERLADDSDGVVAEHANWALDRLKAISNKR